MVKIRLKRLGSKRKPFYRIVIADSRVQRDGKYIELAGTFNPKIGELKIDKEVVLKWLKLGAKPTPTVKKMLSHEGIMAEFANLKTNGKLKVESKTGTIFGKDWDPKVNYTEPGTKPKTAEAEEQAQAAAEVKEETAPQESNEEPKTEAEPKAEAPVETEKTEDSKEETPSAE